MEFIPGSIDGVIWKPLSKYHDARGWLCELFRHDELDPQWHPVMAYASVTQPGVARGPHEHVDQADYFAFFGPSDFKMYVWDNRPNSKTYRHKEVRLVGDTTPMAVIVPVGVVHAYKCVGDVPGLVFNGPNRLYRGPGKKDPVDEIRHEDIADSPFHME